MSPEPYQSPLNPDTTLALGIRPSSWDKRTAPTTQRGCNNDRQAPLFMGSAHTCAGPLPHERRRRDTTTCPLSMPPPPTLRIIAPAIPQIGWDNPKFKDSELHVRRRPLPGGLGVTCPQLPQREAHSRPVAAQCPTERLAGVVAIADQEAPVLGVHEAVHIFMLWPIAHQDFSRSLGNLVVPPLRRLRRKLCRLRCSLLRQGLLLRLFGHLHGWREARLRLMRPANCNRATPTQISCACRDPPKSP